MPQSWNLIQTDLVDCSNIILQVAKISLVRMLEKVEKSKFKGEKQEQKSFFF